MNADFRAIYASMAATEEIKRTIARSLAATRKDAGLTQAQLAEKVGVTESTVVRWEHKKAPKAPGFDTAVLIARALKVSLDELAFGQRSHFERVVAEARRQMEQDLPLLVAEVQRRQEADRGR